MSESLQLLVVGLCVLAALLFVLARYLPRATLAKWLRRGGHGRAAAIVAPAPGGGCHDGGDDGGCGSCGRCDASAPVARPTERPVTFHPSKR